MLEKTQFVPLFQTMKDARKKKILSYIVKKTCASTKKDRVGGKRTIGGRYRRRRRSRVPSASRVGKKFFLSEKTVRKIVGPRNDVVRKALKAKYMREYRAKFRF